MISGRKSGIARPTNPISSPPSRGSTAKSPKLRSCHACSNCASCSAHSSRRARGPVADVAHHLGVGADRGVRRRGRLRRPSGAVPAARSRSRRAATRRPTTRCRTARDACGRRTARGAAGRAAGPASRSARPRRARRAAGKREQRRELGCERGGERGRARCPRPSCGRREQQVLHRGKDRRRRPSPRARARGRRTRRRAPARPRCRRSRRVRRRRGVRVRAASPRTRRPCASHARRVSSPIAARVPASRTITNSHGWRFSALGACVAASSSGASSSSVTGSALNVAARALAGDDREEIEVVHAEDCSPTRANEFTYMMRRLGPNAQCLNASVSVPPMRSITSGVMLLNARSGSSVSIS